MQLTSLAAPAVALVSSTALASPWVLDPTHSAAQFAVKHMMVSTVRGEFQKLSGTVNIDDKDLTRSQVEVTIDVSSINTREPKRDAHLKSPDFFDVERFPTITFKSTRIEKGKGDTLRISGDLTMHGVTKPVVLDAQVTAPAKNPWGQLVRGASASAKLNRKDFGLHWNQALETGGLLVGEEVKLEIDVELNPAPAPTTASAK